MCRLPVLVLAALAVGCGRSGPHVRAGTAPACDPDEFADTVLAEFDANRNGAIDGAELAACPALRKSAAEIDTNRDRKLSRDELKKRAGLYRAAPVVTCQVALDGAPVEGAAVTFVPERCMGGAFRQACGTTDANGIATPTREGADAAGVPCGLYRITVSKVVGGKERLPARYNARTTLGHEVVVGGRAAGDVVVLRLTAGP